MSGSQKFEEQIIDNLKYLVKKLSTSGKEDLDPGLMKKLKHICKQSDTYVTKAYYIILQQCEKKHAEVRFSCFAIIDQLFNRSHCFRCLVLKNFTQIIELVLGPTEGKPTLQPVSVAMKLKKNAISAIKMWYDKFGESYKLLSVGVDYMINCKNVDFSSLTAMSPMERAEEEERQRLSNELKLKTVAKVKTELEEIMPQINSDLAAFKNCMELVIPNVDNFDIPFSDDEMTENTIAETHLNSEKCNKNNKESKNLHQSNELNTPLASDEEEGLSVTEDHSDSEMYGSEYVRSNGILKGINIKIDLSHIHQVQVTEDNLFVVETLNELFKCLKKKWQPSFVRLKSLLAKNCDETPDILEIRNKILALEEKLKPAINSYMNLKFIPISKPNLAKSKGMKLSDGSDSEDDDFVEVEEDSNCSLLQILHSKVKLPNPPQQELISTDAVSFGNKSSVTQQPEVSSSTGKSSNDQTPENFLGEWTPPVFYANPMAGLSQVWLSSSNSQLDDDEDAPRSSGGLLGIATTPVNIETAFKPVLWQCRAPMPSGRICPRRDREKCPLHGRVLPRSSDKGIADIDYAMAVLRRARLRAGLPAEKEEHEANNHLKSTSNTDIQEGKIVGEDLLNSDDDVDEDVTDGIQGNDGIGAGFCLDSSCEDDSAVDTENLETQPEVLESKTRAERKQLCKKLNEESGAAMNTGQKDSLISSTPFGKVKIAVNECIASTSGLGTSHLTLPSTSAGPSDVILPSKAKTDPADVEMEDISVAAAERLMESVKAARIIDKRKRMLLDDDWQNPALLAKLKVITGVDLDLKTAKRRRCSTEGGLTDLRKLKDTPRQRLLTKVLRKTGTRRH